ncbi:unnamed protein product [Urochloa humidicola]
MVVAVKVAGKEKAQSKAVGITIPLHFLRRRHPPNRRHQTVHERHRRVPPRDAPVVHCEMRCLHLQCCPRRHRWISTRCPSVQQISTRVLNHVG